MYQRPDGRKHDELRSVKIERNYLKDPEGSVLICMGDTKVIVTASVEEKVPPFLRNSKTGWLTAEYSMLPRATQTRRMRDIIKGQINGRSQEIQRLIGRSLRSIVDLQALGERTIYLDCDVIQADGGTRTAAITGAMIALYDACTWLREHKKIEEMPIREFAAAISVGIVENTPLLDLAYLEDSAAETDMNVIMTDSGKIIEVQGTAEKEPFPRTMLNQLLDLAEKGIKELTDLQQSLVTQDLQDLFGGI